MLAKMYRVVQSLRRQTKIRLEITFFEKIDMIGIEFLDSLYDIVIFASLKFFHISDSSGVFTSFTYDRMRKNLSMSIVSVVSMDMPIDTTDDTILDDIVPIPDIVSTDSKLV
jgi:pantothenate kinase